MAHSGELWLIRHGDTEWSLSGQHTSRTDLPLTVDGELHAYHVASLLNGKTFTTVLTSPMQRARLTSELAGYGAQAQPDADLLEWNYGDYEGLTTSQIQQQNPSWTIWTSTPPDGEAAAQVGARADRVIARCTSPGSSGDVAIFGHGHMLRVLAARWLGLDAQAGRYFSLGTASVSVLGYEHDVRVMEQWNRRQ